MAAINFILRKIYLFLICLASTALFALMVMTFCDVLLRSVFNAPIEAATELTRILMAVMVFSVLPVISANGGHIAVDLADPLFYHYGIHRISDGAMLIICGVMSYWPVIRIWNLAERARDYGDVTEYLHLPQFLIGGFIAIMVGIAGSFMVGAGLFRLIIPQPADDAS